jgi:hypothetical protein
LPAQVQGLCPRLERCHPVHVCEVRQQTVAVQAHRSAGSLGQSRHACGAPVAFLARWRTEADLSVWPTRRRCRAGRRGWLPRGREQLLRRCLQHDQAAKRLPLRSACWLRRDRDDVADAQGTAGPPAALEIGGARDLHGPVHDRARAVADVHEDEDVGRGPVDPGDRTLESHLALGVVDGGGRTLCGERQAQDTSQQTQCATVTMSHGQGLSPASA